MPAHRIEGSNILYATHPYISSGSEMLPRFWDAYWGFLTATDPVLVTEFGDTGAACSTAYGAEVISYADKHAAGWTAWGWFPKGCTFPSLIDDWAATPSPSGAVVKAALADYDNAPASDQ